MRALLSMRSRGGDVRAATRRGHGAAPAALSAFVLRLLHGRVKVRRPLISTTRPLELPAMRTPHVLLRPRALLRAMVVVMLLRTTWTAEARTTRRRTEVLRPRPLRRRKAVPELLAAKASLETLAAAKAAPATEAAAPLTEALTETVLSAAWASMHVTSKRAALWSTEALSAVWCAKLAAMPKGLRSTTTEASAETTTKATVLRPARPLLMMETVVLLMLLAVLVPLISASLRRIDRAGTPLRLGAALGAVLLAALLSVHWRTAEVSAPLIVIHATVVATLGLCGAAPALILRRVHGGTRARTLSTLGSAAWRPLRTRGSSVTLTFGSGRVPTLRCGGWWRALRSGLLR